MRGLAERLVICFATSRLVLRYPGVTWVVRFSYYPPAAVFADHIGVLSRPPCDPLDTVKMCHGMERVNPSPRNQWNGGFGTEKQRGRV